MKLTAAQSNALRSVASSLGIMPAWLEAIINFETAGTWDPQIKNPNSSARGLIQFLDATARNLGYASSADLVNQFPTIESQLLGPVLKYFKQFGPFQDQQDFALSVFLPKYRKSDLDTVIYAEDPDTQAKFQQANPGIVTVGDYFNKLQRAFAKTSITLSEGIGGVTLLCLAVGAAVFFLATGA